MAEFKNQHNQSMPLLGTIILVSLILIEIGVCLVPFNYRPDFHISLFQHSLPLHHLIFTLSGLLLMAITANVFIKKKELPSFIVVSAVLLASMLLSAAFTLGDKRDAFQTCLGFFVRGLVPGFAAYVLVTHFNGEKPLSHFLIGLGGLISCASLFELFTGRYFLFDRFASQFTASDGFASGPVGQPLPLAVLLNLLFPLSLMAWNATKRWTVLLVTALIALTIVLTFRRSGYLLMLSTSVLFFAVSSQKKKGVLLLLGLIGALLLLNATSPYIRKKTLDRFSIASTIREIESAHRTRTYGTTAKIFVDHPWLGLGTRQFTKLHGQYATYKKAIDSPDNQYLRFLSEGGVVGFLAFLLFIGWILRTVWIHRATMEDWAYFFSLINFSLALILVDGLYWPALQTTFLVVAGAAVGKAHLNSNQMNREMFS